MIFEGSDTLLKYLKLNEPEIIKKYDQRVFTFDIETSAGFLTPGSLTPVKFDYDKPPVFYRDCTPVAICYLWQFGIDDTYFYGRELSDLIPVFDYLANQEHKTILFIHNLSYEFFWLLNILKYTKVFARRPHKPITAAYQNLEFRCTYMMTRQALEAVGAGVGMPKLKELMHYDDIYHPASELPADIIRYGIRDIEILYKYINKIRGPYDLLQKIPLTQTGFVRHDVREIYAKDWHYHVKMSKMIPTFKMYEIERACFVGGYVHANYQYINETIRSVLLMPGGIYDPDHGVGMADIRSSYPLQMLKKYPQTPWSHCDDPEDFDYYMKKKSFICMVKIECTNIESRYSNDYLSKSKILRASSGIQDENGRIYKAESFTAWMTDIDYRIMLKAYRGSIKIIDLYYSRAGYLDIRYIKYMLQLYNDKVLLTGTGDPVKEELRARSKERLNSCYGMCVSALVYEDCKFIDNQWQPTTFNSPEEMEEYYEKQLRQLRGEPAEDGEKDRRYNVFLRYAHGVWVTAYAREMLWNAMEAVGHDNVVYHDTDSIYFKGDQRAAFHKLNDQNHKDLLKMAKIRRLDPDLLHPNALWLGDWEIEQAGDPEGPWMPYAEFRTLGAKRYAYRKKPTDDIKITISGVNKKKGPAALHDDIERFNDQMVFDYEECGRLIPHYNDDQPDTDWIDENGKHYLSSYRYGITLQPTRYDFNIHSLLDVLVARGSLSNSLAEMDIEDLDI